MSLVERKRQLVRDELTEAALKLLAFQGFEETTIDQMAAAAGVSRRTFFRYFQSKEDVIIEFLSDLGRKLSDALAARPESEPPELAVQNALRVFTDTFWDHPEKSRRLAEVTICTPSLLARYLERQAGWKATLTAELARRMHVDPSSDVRPAIIVAVSFAAFDTALTRWVESDATEDLTTLVETCFAAAFPPPPTA
ncbi:TetR family transcriptional regulator [Dactylosporangium fulvum]|uniref:TetR family transcriptional regulator n=1 Tax=Dactylosporangium fulvum TaxID=53359 RepID=A0ABY5W2J8_9ACTN|nr:TetR family transcriptional regulator [Dactylosporangium fulvum]UWP83571.1 TetR family transcriptional regulator [Dactylosporangium fulvum]